MKNNLFHLVLIIGLVSFGIKGVLPPEGSPEKSPFSFLESLPPEIGQKIFNLVITEPDFIKAVKSAESLTEVSRPIQQVIFDTLVSRFKKTEAQKKLYELIEQGTASPFALDILKEAGASLDRGSYVLGGLTPLEWAVDKGNIKLVKMLIDKGADLDEGVVFDYPLQYAKNDEMIKLLVNEGAKLGKQDRGTILLSKAVSENNENLAIFLLDKGAHPDFSSIEEESPLQIATTKGNIKLVKLLLAKGADPDYGVVGSESLLQIVQKRMKEATDNNKVQAYQQIIDLLIKEKRNK